MIIYALLLDIVILVGFGDTLFVFSPVGFVLLSIIIVHLSVPLDLGVGDCKHSEYQNSIKVI